jgi:[protein-PII] uridylyltransferase
VHFSWRENPALTIVELITDDRPGLLATVGRIFQHQGIRLHTAKIATIGEHVEDVFFITDTEHAPLTQPERLEQLQQTLCEALDKDEEPC